MMRAVWIDNWVLSFSTWPWPQETMEASQVDPFFAVDLARYVERAVDNPDDGWRMTDERSWMMDDDDGWRMRDDDDGWWMMVRGIQ